MHSHTFVYNLRLTTIDTSSALLYFAICFGLLVCIGVVSIVSSTQAYHISSESVFILTSIHTHKNWNNNRVWYVTDTMLYNELLFYYFVNVNNWMRYIPSKMKRLSIIFIIIWICLGFRGIFSFSILYCKIIVVLLCVIHRIEKLKTHTRTIERQNFHNNKCDVTHQIIWFFFLRLFLLLPYAFKHKLMVSVLFGFFLLRFFHK